MMWGKKMSLPPPPYLYAYQVRVVGMVVLHSPDRFCGGLPCGSAEWAAVPITVPLGHDDGE
jgi:hypothetical protein